MTGILNTVVLAGGRGSRMRGVAAPYHKPMLVVNGRPLVVNAASIALEQTAGLVTIVAAPDNVVPMTALLRDALPSTSRLRVIVQLDPGGPGDAFILGSEVDTAERTVVLLGDNTLTDEDFKAVTSEDADLVVGFDIVDDPDEAIKFTRILPNGQIVEWPRTSSGELWPDDRYHVWVGPLIVPTVRMRNVLEVQSIADGEERKLGRYLSNLGIHPKLVPVSSSDVGYGL